MNPALTNPTVHETLIGRTTYAFAEALEDVGIDDHWMERTMRELLPHIACELIVHEQNEGRSLTLQEAAKFLCAEAGQ
jgi:uncharacterized membrane protein